MYDVVVVGAGPVGLYAARLCEKSGLNVLVLEEHKAVGEPNHCSGLISTNIKDFIKVDKSWIEHSVKGAILRSCGGKEVSLKKPATAAYVIDRAKFDKSLSKGLKSKILFDTRVEGIEVRNDCVLVKTYKGNFEAKLLLGCDGFNSVVAKAIGSRPAELVKGIIAITKEKCNQDFVEMWFDKTATADGFLWKIPRGKTTEYGMMSSGADFKTLESFFKLKSKSIIERRGSMIPIGPAKTYSDRVLLVGDAAAQVKPWSGGGVVYGLTCAKIAAEVVKDAVDKNNFSESFLLRYELKWKEAIGKNITAGLMFREFYKEASKEEVEKFFDLAGQIKSMNALDMDFPLLSALEF